MNRILRTILPFVLSHLPSCVIQDELRARRVKTYRTRSEDKPNTNWLKRSLNAR